MSLHKTLPRIAARVLHNTHVMPSRLREKFDLIGEAYGRATVEEDFEKWCEEVSEEHPRYPLTDYVKVVDARLGPTLATPQVNVKDPRIAEISSEVYDETGFLPPVRSVATLLAGYDVQEVLGAFREFVKTLDAKDYKTAMRTFFAEGGATAVIYARRKRNKS